MLTFKAPAWLYHPKVTLAAVIGALTSVSVSGGAFITALAPFLKFQFLEPYWHVIKQVDGDIAAVGGFCLALAGLLSAVAGAGRSFNKAIDSGVTP